MTPSHELSAVDMRYSELLAQGFGCYEQLRLVDDINNSGSYELRPLDAMNDSRSLMI